MAGSKAWLLSWALEEMLGHQIWLNIIKKGFRIFSVGLLITVRKSKTIQFQNRLLKIPISRYPNLCAVYWCERHFTEIPAGKDELAFRIPSVQGVIALKLFGSKAGYDTALEPILSSHSLRWGSCTFLSLCGATLEELRTRGDWSSDAIFEYIKTPLPIRIINDMRVASLLASDWFVFYLCILLIFHNCNVTEVDIPIWYRLILTYRRGCGELIFDFT